MDSFSGYMHLEKVHEFSQSIVFRAQNKQDNRPVIIKSYKQECSAEQIIEINKRYQRIAKLESLPILKTVDLIIKNNKVAIIWEDTGAMFLSVILLHNRLSIAKFLAYAVSITRNFGALHNQKITHNDICPHNILINEKTGETVFIGLEFHKFPLKKGGKKSSFILREDPFLYTSPEQTGRINWQVDQRSDLYALGVTFYEMIGEQVPFDFFDERKRMHGHLAIEPASLTTINKSIPTMVDKIIMKLLAKRPQDRYQSAFGLLRDFLICDEQYASKSLISPFELAQKDYIEQFHLPSKLYGAQKSIVALMESFNRVCTGSVEMVIVQGRAGMGKTTLVRNLLETVLLKGGFLAQGKCEQRRQETPYYSLIKAFRTLVRQLLTEDEASKKKWKDKFLENFARNGQLVIDFIPEMESIIGPQPKLPNLDPDETQTRLIYVFRRFIQTFSQDGRPLVVFLDSFRWADLASIQLIQAVLTDINSRYVLVIIARQEDRITHFHTLSVALDEIQKSGTNIQQISVNPLGLSDICFLIEEALNFKQDYSSLGGFILEKTEGNPYFAKQLLQSFSEKKLIHFDPGVGRWEWDLDTIRSASFSEDAADLIAEKIKNLPLDTIEAMKMASCLGEQFDLQTLALASEKNEEMILKLLDEPIELGLVRQVRQGREYLPDIETFEAQDNLVGMTSFQFTHGKVLAATYSLLGSAERKKTHLMLGRLLQKVIPRENVDQRTYKIVNHMNEGMSLIRKQSEKHELARLNLVAGTNSKLAAAFETAWKYFAVGSELLSEKSWEKEYDLSKELYLKRSKCEYFIGNTEAAEPTFELLLKHVKTNQEKVEVISIKINLYLKNNRPEQATEIGLEALHSLFKERIPPNEAEVNIVSQVKMQEIQDELEQKKIENLLFLHIMADTDKKAMMDLISSIIPAAHLTRRNLWIFLTLKMVELSLHFGNTDCSAFGYMNYAVILCSALQDYDSGYAMGSLALDLNSKFNNVNLISQLCFLFGSYINHWKEKAKDNLTYLRRSYRAGIEHGDYISAANSVDILVKSLIIVGSPLEEIQNEINKNQDIVDQLNNRDLEIVLHISKFILQLRVVRGENSELLQDQNYQKNFFEKIGQKKNNQLWQWYYLIMAQIHFLFYDHGKALEYIQESDKLLAGYSQLVVPEHYFYFSLIIVEKYDDFSEEEKKRYWDTLKSNQQKLVDLAKDCPINFLDKCHLIAAKMACISGNFIKAVDLFDEAIKSAAENGFIQNKAIANELAAKYFLSKGKFTIASAYLREACQAYIKWGASAKVEHLENLYPNLLIKGQRFNEAVETLDSSKDKSSKSNFFDLATIVKASQSISGEMVLDKLVEKLLKMLLENTSSHKAYFLIEKNRQLIIMAEGLSDRDPRIKLCSIQLEEFEQIAQSVVFYVIRRRKLVVLDEAAKDSMFAYNKYIRENKPKSILCIPVINRGKLSGIIYLENSSTVRAFTPRQVELLTLLISQVSISIENCMLYTNLAEITDQLSSSKTKLEKRIQILEQELASRFF